MLVSLGFVSLQLSCCVWTPQAAERGQQLVGAASWWAQLPTGKWQHLDLVFGEGSGGCEGEGNQGSRGGEAHVTVLWREGLA